MGFRTITPVLGPYDGLGSYDAQDGAVAYCLDQAYPGPSGTSDVYTPYDNGWSWCTDARAVITWNGYPRTASIAGVELTPDEARAATQIALYMHAGTTQPDGSYRYTPTYDPTEEVGTYRGDAAQNRVVDAAAALYEGARTGSLSAPERCCRIYHAVKNPYGLDRQNMLYIIPSVDVTLTKVSADASFTAENEEYAYVGATYDVFDAENESKVATITTNDKGHATLRLLANHSYYAVETRAPAGFTLNPEHIPFTTGSANASVELPDEPGRAHITIKKKDAATGGAAQPGATLEGAEFKLVDARGTSQTATTDKDGAASFGEVPFGRVTITETKAPAGYKLDPTVHEYHIGADTPMADGVAEVTLQDDFAESVIAFDIALQKYRESGAEGSGLQQPAKGVRFDIISNTTGACIGSITTDAYGKATTEGGTWLGSGTKPAGVTGSIPYDAKGYTVKEDPATTPAGYQPAPAWPITPEQMADGATLHYIVDNDFVSTRLCIVKIDAESGQTVPVAGFTFQLLDANKQPITQENWYPNHVELDCFTTDESGSVTLPQALKPGTYYVREVAAMPPYLLNGTDNELTIAPDGETAPMVVMQVADEQARGSASLHKRCRADDTALAGAEYDVVARHDVLSPDGTVQAVEGEIVDHVTTDGEGLATVDGLALGSGSATYAFVETKAPSGHVLDETPHEFTVSYQSPDADPTTVQIDVQDAPTHLVVEKRDATSGAALAGATFALWNAQDEIPSAGDEAGGLVAIRGARDLRLTAREVLPSALVSLTVPADIAGGLQDANGAPVEADEDGTWTLPAGTYRVVARRGDTECDVRHADIEVKASMTYTLTLHDERECLTVDATEHELADETALAWSDEDDAHIARGLSGTVRIYADGTPLGEIQTDRNAYALCEQGALRHVPILLRDGKEPREFTSNEQGNIDVEHLAPGTYRLQETAAPEGFIVDHTTREVHIDEAGRANGEDTCTIAIDNACTKIDIEKRDAETENVLAGARLAILDNKGNVVDTWISETEPHRVERLAPGTYTLRELATPQYFDTAPDLDFTVTETDEVQRITMYDRPIEVSGRVDKRQEIATPTVEGTQVDTSGTNRAEAATPQNGSFSYTLDYRSDANTWVDEFTVTDDLLCVHEGLAEVTGITTAQGARDFDGKLNVWYTTNRDDRVGIDADDANATLDDGHENPWLSNELTAERLGGDGRAVDYTGWHLWARDVPADEATKLDVASLDLAQGERICGIRFEYGRVEAGFSTRADGWKRDDVKDPHDDLETIERQEADGETATADGNEADKGGAASIDDGAASIDDGAPAIIDMRVTDSYIAGTTLENTARVELFRNGGGDKLEGRDDDRVVQAPSAKVSPLAQTGSALGATAACIAAATGGVALLMRAQRCGKGRRSRLRPRNTASIRPKQRK